MKMKPVPEGAKALVLVHWCCGDDCCCCAMQIRAVFTDIHPLTPHYWAGKGDWSRELWESGWFWPADGMEHTDWEELRGEIKTACDHYGIPVHLGENRDHWDWKAQRDLATTDDKGSA